MKKIILFLTLLLSMSITAQTRRPVQKRPVQRAVKKNTSAPVPVEVKDSVITFDFIITENSRSGMFIKTGENFYVVPFSKKTAHDLYNDVLVRIAHLYKSPETVTEKNRR